MSHPLVEKLEHLAGGWNRRVVVSFAATAIAAALAVVFVGGLLDYLVRPHDTGLRTLLSLAVAGGIIFAGVWAARNIRRRQHSPFGIARQVEQTFPELGDRLASAVEFLQQDEADARAGSAELRRRVISEATAASDTVTVAEALTLPGERRWLPSMIAALAVLAVLLVATPSLVATAAMRLVAPWGNAAWPRDVHLAFVELPTLVARGDNFEAELVNSSGDLPSDTQLEFRYRHDGRTTVERMPAARVGDRLLARRQNVQRSFDLRATGGDDRVMQWHSVEVVDPPQLAQSEARLSPPSHSGIASTIAERQLRVLEGTQIEWTGTAKEPIAAGQVEIVGLEPIPITVDPVDATRLSIPAERWVAVAGTGESTYRISLTNTSGLVGYTPSYTYEVVTDNAPTIEWASSPVDESITARAIVPVALRAGDDLAVKAVDVVVQSPNEEGMLQPIATQQLLDGPSDPPPLAELPATSPAAASVEGRVDIDPLAPPVGSQLQLVGHATDYAGEVAATERQRRLLVVSDEEFASLVAGAQQSLLSELLRALEAQRSAQQQSSRLAAAVAAGEPIDRASIDAVIAATVEQRQVESLLGDDPLGVRPRAAALRQRIANNRMEAAEVDAQLATIDRVLGELLDGQLPAIEQHLSDARASLERFVAASDTGDREAAAAALSASDAPQREVIVALEALLDEMKQWGDTEQFLRELALLEEAQRNLADRAAELSAEQMKAAAEGRDDAALDEKARHLADQQRELARRFRRVEQGLKGLADSPDISDELRQQLSDAVDEAADRQLARNMSDAARQLAAGQASRASDAQRQAADDLADLLDQLRGRTPTDPAALADALREAARELDKLRSETQQNANREDGPQQEQERQRLAGRMQRLARELRRLTAPAAGDSTQLAGESMQQENGEQPEQQADEQLAEAQRQLANRLAQLEQEQEQRELDRLAEELNKLIPKQREVINRTLALETEMPTGDDLPRELIDALEALADQEALLASELRFAIDNVSARQVFQLALRGAADDMQRAADRLAEYDPGRTTQTAELAALARMQHVADVLNPPPPPDDPADDEQSGGGGGGNGEQPPPPVIDLAEVKMLRWLQVELNGRTRQNEAELAASADVGDDQQQYSERLAGEQRRLAELVGEMLQRRGPPEQSAPDL